MTSQGMQSAAVVALAGEARPTIAMNAFGEMGHLLTLAGGKDDAGNFHALHVEPDGSVRCAR
jgi:hypothetical protein